MSNEDAVAQIFNLYKKHGRADYIGEDVSQIEHMTQAAMLAEEDGHSSQIILGALFHDIGHLVALDCDGTRDELGATDHEQVAYDYLTDMGVPYPIPDLALGHVVAKRYLISKCPLYYDSLSPSSKKTFLQQGGILNTTECGAFENNILFNEKLLIRKYDDRAKVKDKSIRDISHYEAMLRKLLAAKI